MSTENIQTDINIEGLIKETLSSRALSIDIANRFFDDPKSPFSALSADKRFSSRLANMSQSRMNLKHHLVTSDEHALCQKLLTLTNDMLYQKVIYAGLICCADGLTQQVSGHDLKPLLSIVPNNQIVNAIQDSAEFNELSGDITPSFANIQNRGIICFLSWKNDRPKMAQVLLDLIINEQADNPLSNLQDQTANTTLTNQTTSNLNADIFDLAFNKEA